MLQTYSQMKVFDIVSVHSLDGGCFTLKLYFHKLLDFSAVFTIATTSFELTRTLTQLVAQSDRYSED